MDNVRKGNFCLLRSFCSTAGFCLHLTGWLKRIFVSHVGEDLAASG